MQTVCSIAVLLFDNVNAIDVTGPIEAFSTAKNGEDTCPYSIEFWGLEKHTFITESGLKLSADYIAPKKPDAHTLIIPGGAGIRHSGNLTRLAQWLSKHHENFARIVSICTGAYAAAEAGLLNGRKVTTHWAHADDFQERFPHVQVNANALFLKDGKFHSSGGVTAGIDLALDLIHRDVGEAAAMSVAREMVVFLRRPGAQTQFSLPLQMQSMTDDRLSDVCRWAASNLHEDLTIERLAERTGLSSRQFARRFKNVFDMPPAAYIKNIRLDHGRSLLSKGSSISQAAFMVGFSSSDGFQRAFKQRFGIDPSSYQKHFSESSPL
ncbi:GlxA family transcriptional regulator [Parasphingorhabdus cellanae]|uniref:GlxA family transcriptional regulator n=1 Tax=Parasphingorhabdus cellanae TaxID=2806553 RepID=A0ABX7T753_9SPHN|nr:GlxA family transcriptional regulator [Parasphingorhabdus cellanae]QTD57331.1 GlxA family transcriptional regulator [Parasphingorhabdus cellanae]